MIQWFSPSCLRRLLFSQGLATRHRFASLLLGLLLAFVSGHGQKAHPSVLRIDDYGLHYKGDTLHPGQDTTRWIEVLGLSPSQQSWLCESFSGLLLITNCGGSAYRSKRCHHDMPELSH